MDQAAQDWIEQKNEFAKHEAEQERQAYEAKMRKDVEQIEAPPESGPKPVVAAIAGGVVLQKRHHGALVLEGVCSRCAHCGMKLTDAESVERGLGPVCCKKGYFEEPKDGDEMQAMIDLAEYPELVEFLMKHYKPQGARGFVNGLVRVCSLNRKSEVHQACTDAVDSLGYKKLASLLRESLCVVEISKSTDFPGSLEVWCKKADWKYAFTNALKGLAGAYFSRKHRATIVPLEKLRTNTFGDKEDIKIPITSWDPTTGQQNTHRRIVWNLLCQHYEGYFARTPQGAVRVRRLP